MQHTPPEGAADILFIGNATLLIRYGELTLLTDPNFLHRGQPAHLGYGLVSRRVTEPAVDVADLPHADLDAVVLSHLHGDHFDRVARRGLDRGLPFVTTTPGREPTWPSSTCRRKSGTPPRRGKRWRRRDARACCCRAICAIRPSAPTSSSGRWRNWAVSTSW